MHLVFFSRLNFQHAISLYARIIHFSRCTISVCSFLFWKFLGKHVIRNFTSLSVLPLTSTNIADFSLKVFNWRKNQLKLTEGFYSWNFQFSLLKFWAKIFGLTMARRIFFSMIFKASFTAFDVFVWWMCSALARLCVFVYTAVVCCFGTLPKFSFNCI